MQEINTPKITPPSPDVLHAATGAVVIGDFKPEEGVHTLIPEGPTRKLVVSDREPLMDEQTVAWKWRAPLGRLVAEYELPYPPSGGEPAIEASTLLIFDATPSGKHAKPNYIVTTPQALEELQGREADAPFAHPDLLELGEGQHLTIGRGDRWLPQGAQNLLKNEQQRLLSEEQATFEVRDGRLLLDITGHNTGFFVAKPSEQEHKRMNAEQRHEAALQAEIAKNQAALGIDRVGSGEYGSSQLPRNFDSGEQVRRRRRGYRLGTLLRGSAHGDRQPQQKQ